MARKDIFLEDAVLDDISQGLEIVERPFSSAVFRSFGLFIVALACFVLMWVSYFDVIKGFFYKDRALANTGRSIVLRAPRGIIYSSSGKALVSNEPTFSAVINLSEFFKNKETSIDDSLRQLRSVFAFDVDQVREALLSVDLEHQAYLSIGHKLSLADVSAVRKLDRPDIFIEEDFSRVYWEDGVFSHLVGYVGAATPEDVEENQTLSLNDDIGKSGIEARYDPYIRGENGRAVLFYDAKGNLLERSIEKEVASGASVYTTIDDELQEVVSARLSEQLRSLGRTKGAALVMDPSSGRILSLVSLPSFDANNISSDLFSDPDRPTFNRVISGVYSPGSTIKPLVAFGALEEGIVDPLTSILSIGYIEIPNPYNPDRPSRFVDWKPQGWVNIYSALARSSNVYFYEVGGGFQNQEGLGIDRLKQYWNKFFLDKKSGIDLPGETSGFLPDPDIKEARTGDIWRIGDTYNVSIGQGDLLVTPLALLRYVGAIAERGILHTPYVVDEIRDASGEVVYQHLDGKEFIEAKDQENFSVVERGMIDAVTKDYGTAHLLASIPMDIAAKTGSAQIQNNQKTNAFFVGYAPVSHPRIAVLVLIEDAKEGSLNAVPVAQSIFKWYYENRIANEE